ncbi:sonic hedgehog protein-like [Lineus longissimus]|uniref:sonic hedgehog protein-like n=1 Tax=Lineus longissimus TaxID=88925 RepID=UPI00315D02B2
MANRTNQNIQLLFLLFLLLFEPASQCGPGRGSGRRRGPKKMTPLVYKQHVPNVSENTLGASGIGEGKISRTDKKKFNQLVVNHNPDIVFRMEERTDADRRMTQRCKDKLSTLAVSVMNQWPGVRLRVTEAWDEDNEHARDSLHYEGRAVDITTSDRDRAKYGMLARLAVDAGFDWVYYESRGHIHCSVKSDSSAQYGGGCFPAEAVVNTEKGAKLMRDLQIGDSVLAMSKSGEVRFSEVIMFMDRQPNATALFYQLTTDANTTLQLTPSHLVYVSRMHQSTILQAKTVFAKDVRIGDYMFIASGRRKVRPVRVVWLSSSVEQGIYAPLTGDGTIVVDRSLASCYAVINYQSIAHFAFAPVRLISSIKSTFRGQVSEQDKRRDTEETTGVHWYPRTLYDIAPYVLPDRLLYSTNN